MTHVKKTILTLSVLTISSLSLAQPVSAANPFQNFADSFKDRLTKIYLQLPGSKSGQAVLKESAEAMMEVRSARSSIDTTAQLFDLQDQEVATVKVSASGVGEMQNPADPNTVKQEVALTGTLSMQGTAFTLNADMKIDGQTVYMNLHQLPVLPFVDLSGIQNQWLKLDQNVVAGQSIPAQSLTTEQRQRLSAAGVKLLTNAKVSQARKENLDDHKVFVMDVTFTDEALAEYMRTTAEVYGLTEEQKTQQEKGASEFLAAADEVVVKLWVDRSSYYLRKYEAPVNIDVQKVRANAGAVEAVENAQESEVAQSQTMTPFTANQNLKTIKMVIMGTVDDFNQPVSIEMPTDARSFQEVWSEVMSKMGSGLGGQTSLFPTQTEPVGVTEAVNEEPRIPASEFSKLSPEQKQMLKDAGVSVGN